MNVTAQFQSTRPVWGATKNTTASAMSIIAFQSTRPVWGATEIADVEIMLEQIFQSTRPVWGATTGEATELAD